MSKDTAVNGKSSRKVATASPSISQQRKSSCKFVTPPDVSVANGKNSVAIIANPEVSFPAFEAPPLFATSNDKTFFEVAIDISWNYL